MLFNDNSNVNKSQKENLNLATDQLQKVFSEFYNSFNATLQEVQHYEKQLVSQLQEIQKQKEKLEKAYQQEHQHVKKLHKVLELIHDIFNADNEKKVFNKVFEILTTLYPKAIVKILSSNKKTNNIDIILSTENVDPEKEWFSVSPAKSIMNLTHPKISCCNQDFKTEHVSLSRNNYNNVYVPLLSDEDFVYYIYIISNNGMPVVKKYDEDIINTVIKHSSLAINKLRILNILKKESHTDVLTGLPNRRCALKILDQEIKRAKRYNDVFSIAAIDIDNFKIVNDTYGHDEGDRVLSLLADVAASCFRSTDTVARFGGEEFLVILPKTQGIAAVQVLNRFRNAFNKATLSGKLKVKDITVSAGIAQYPIDGEDVESLLKTADSNLYKAKNSGRNRVEWLSSDLEQTSSMQIS